MDQCFPGLKSKFEMIPLFYRTNLVQQNYFMRISVIEIINGDAHDAPPFTSKLLLLDQSTTAAVAAATMRRLCGSAPSKPGVDMVNMTVSLAGLLTNLVLKKPCQL